MNKPSSPQSSDLDLLRQLLVRPEQEKLEQISERLESREKFAAQVSEVLPQAMVTSSRQGEQLSEAMVPTVEEIVRISINRDINRFADALFPVIGPAIRKAISESIRQMVQSLNQMLESSLSIQGLKWRWQSIRTGVSFAEVVMLHSLIYRVEQVFLVHRSTGLLLSHIAHDSDPTRDADLVSSMLSAIGDFVGDSFAVDRGEALDTIQFGELSIWIDQGADTLLALAIRGDAPVSLRATMQHTREEIQAHFADSIVAFEGDTDAFEATRPYLETCLQARYQPQHGKVSRVTRLIGLLVFLLFGFWMLLLWHGNHLEGQYLNLVEREPGYVVTGIEHEDDKLVLRGLRDPLAREPSLLLALSQLPADQVIHHFRPYQSLDKQFVHRRMLQLIEPPANVELEVVGDGLVVKGYASKAWIEEFRQRVPMLAGIGAVDSSDLSSQVDLGVLEAPSTVTLKLDLERGVLSASGRATASWRAQARQKSLALPGVDRFDDSRLQILPDLADIAKPQTVNLAYDGDRVLVSGSADSNSIARLRTELKKYPAIATVDFSQLVNSDRAQLRQAASELRDQVVYFREAESFSFLDTSVIDNVVSLAQRIVGYARNLSLPVKIVVHGYTDSRGNFQDNKALSRERADFVAQHLYNVGINPRYIEIRGIERPVQTETSRAERRANRRVYFEVLLGMEDELG